MANMVKKVSPEQNPAFIQFLQMIPDSKEFVFQFLDMFPIPVEVFAPDGLSIFCNRAFLKVNNIPDAALVDGKYNLLNDPVMDQMGMKDCVQRAFRGEVIAVYDVDAPVQDMVDRGLVDGKPYEKSLMDWHLYPIMDGEKPAFVVFVMNVKKLYYGRPDLARAREYMDTHWKDKYDPEAVAKAMTISVSQLYSLFKQHTRMTPGDYHKQCKVEHIKEKLKDENLSIKEAFAACGEDSHGWFPKVFKEITGKSPKEYRDTLI